MFVNWTPIYPDIVMNWTASAEQTSAHCHHVDLYQQWAHIFHVWDTSSGPTASVLLPVLDPLVGHITVL